MTIAFQLVVFALIVTSSILLISVPIVFTSSIFWCILMDWISISSGYS